MRATVLDVDDKHIYLEIDQQLRFRSAYKCPSVADKPTRADHIEFHFQRGCNAIIVIDQIERSRSRRPR